MRRIASQPSTRLPSATSLSSVWDPRKRGSALVANAQAILTASRWRQPRQRERKTRSLHADEVFGHRAPACLRGFGKVDEPVPGPNGRSQPTSSIGTRRAKYWAFNLDTTAIPATNSKRPKYPVKPSQPRPRIRIVTRSGSDERRSGESGMKAAKLGEMGRWSDSYATTSSWRTLRPACRWGWRSRASARRSLACQPGDCVEESAARTISHRYARDRHCASPRRQHHPRLS